MAETKKIENLNKLINFVKETAESFGFDQTTNGSDGNGNGRGFDKNKPNWFGFTREEEYGNSQYEGLSFVVFPSKTDELNQCLVTIGIGRGNVGQDAELAANPAFRRSFMRLCGNNKDIAKFFFKVHFDNLDISTPNLQENITSGEFDKALVEQVTNYNANEDSGEPGLLPAAMLINDYETEGAQKLIVGWLAQYAKWRNWHKYKGGTDKITAAQKIEEAINAVTTDRSADYSTDRLFSSLIKNKYIVLQGAPGCGKTWSANEIANKKFSPDNVFFTQFHAETTYADFVYGIKPVLNGITVAYKGEKGILLRAIDKAMELSDKKDNDRNSKNVLLIIDEINRANLANVLGPVFYLFEPNAKDRKYKLLLGEEIQKKEDGSYKEVKLEYDSIPDNLYVIATMNTADRSIAVVDFALRRRFAWITLRPHKLNASTYTNFDEELYTKIDDIFVRHATDFELNLQPGQSYFLDKDMRYDNIVYGLMPLMKEYFSEGFMLSAKDEICQLFYLETGISMYE